MNIPSFTIDHTRLKKGVYVSRIDRLVEEQLTTFDIRVIQPYVEVPMSPEVSHTIEHLGAYYLRTHDNDNKVVYFGPMGCLTGFYLIYKCVPRSYVIKPMLIHLFRFIESFNGPIPGATKEQCGNYKLNDLEGAKEVAKNFLYVLYNLNKENIEYPK